MTTLGTENIVKIGVLKLGNIGISPLLDLILDERADRGDIDIRVVGSGPKLTPEQTQEAAQKLIELRPKLVIVSSPNASLPGPSRARELLNEAKIPTISLSDAPGKKATKDIEEKGQGYIILLGDPLIGARREFLDSTEMALFNSDAIRVLSITGAMRLIMREVDSVVEQIKQGKSIQLPKVVVDGKTVVNSAEFKNPYARARAIAAYEMTGKVAELNTQACFILKEPQEYIQMATAAHEMMRQAAMLAESAREMEKCGDSVYRQPHKRDGTLVNKKSLMEKPQ
ncbi:MAG: F420-dependent methylenetetrahydromethanopterin dehydrogenase [Promethearchaeati archaeon SRVP18_Atabeyarchaeia-1]